MQDKKKKKMAIKTHSETRNMNKREKIENRKKTKTNCSQRKLEKYLQKLNP